MGVPGRPVARLADAFTCPVCERIVHGAENEFGYGWYACPRRPCPALWFDVTLPRGATAADLARFFGAEATALLTALLPPAAQAAVAETGVFTPAVAAEPRHVQIVAARKQHHRCRRAPLAQQLRILIGLDAASSRQGAA